MSHIPSKADARTKVVQGGHALLSVYTEGAYPLHKVTCVTRGHALGLVCFFFKVEDDFPETACIDAIST